MVYQSNSIIVGAAQVYVSAKDSLDVSWGTSPSGIPLPALTPNTTAKVALNASAAWRNVGFTQEGIEVTVEPDFGEVQTDQTLDTPKMYKQGMRVSVNTTLAEASLTNLVLAWGQNESTLNAGTLTLSAGTLGEAPVERSLAFVGPGEGVKKERVYYVRRALQVESSAHRLSRNDPTAIPVSFRLLPEVSISGNSDYGQVIERANAA
jgi:hypothetical protein